MTVVRIPLRSAKHHFGVSLARGNRPYNEDTYQAGVIEIPAFAKRAPMSLTRSQKSTFDSADGASGDPQVFYFGVFDGHGGSECSAYLREHLHQYIECSAKKFDLRSSLGKSKTISDLPRASTDGLSTPSPKDNDALKLPEKIPGSAEDAKTSTRGAHQISQPLHGVGLAKAIDLERDLIARWKETVGGYFRRFKPVFFSLNSGGRGYPPGYDIAQQTRHSSSARDQKDELVGIETVVVHAFLQADFDFVTAQVEEQEDLVRAERALNEGEILGEPHKLATPEEKRAFKGGSTCSIAMISTPSPMPFWHPASPSTLLTCHVGDTRILLCSTATGAAVPLTTNHHPSSPGEGSRLRRYAGTFVTDSFGEERMSGLANTRAFGDKQSKRLGVSAEPEIRRVELGPAEYSFIVLVSDGVSGTLNDQEIVDIVKEAKTPDEGARDVVSFATEVSREGDNATCLVVRLGGWERREEGGVGAMGTREAREWRRQEATDPRRRRT
jgi:protein phosphatase PTC6